MIGDSWSMYPHPSTNTGEFPTLPHSLPPAVSDIGVAVSVPEEGSSRLFDEFPPNCCDPMFTGPNCSAVNFLPAAQPESGDYIFDISML